MSSHKKTPTKTPLKSILRVTNRCYNSAKKKTVRFCDELIQVLLITPRQVLRRSERNRKKKEEEEELLNSLSDLSLTGQSDAESDNLSESDSKQRAKKISKRLKRAVQFNNETGDSKSNEQCQYYEKVEHEVERRLTKSKTISTFTAYDYMERISLLETELWSEVFMPTKPFLSDINNDVLVMFIDWLKACAAPIFKNNNVSQRVRGSFKVSQDLNYDGLVAENVKHEPRTTIIYGRTGSGKTQLVQCAAESVGFEIFELSASDLRDQDSLKQLIEEAEFDFSSLINHKGRKRSEFQMPLIFLDDADVYFESDTNYKQCLIHLIETTTLPIVLTVTDKVFALNLCEGFDESQIQIMTLHHGSEHLAFQLKHFVSTLFISDFSDKEISEIIEASGSDIRFTLNKLQFFYAPIIMRPLYEKKVSSKICGLSLPKFEKPKAKADARQLAELQFDLYRSGLIKSDRHNEVFDESTGYNNENAEESYSALSEILVQTYNDLAYDFNVEPHTETKPN